jgi:hypothetical protein
VNADARVSECVCARMCTRWLQNVDARRRSKSRIRREHPPVQGVLVKSDTWRSPLDRHEGGKRITSVRKLVIGELVRRLAVNRLITSRDKRLRQGDYSSDEIDECGGFTLIRHSACRYLSRFHRAPISKFR